MATPAGTFDLLRSCAPTLSCGILSADLMNLEAELRVLEQTGIRVLHYDVMDGCFVPLMTVGPPLIKATRTALIKDVHLMVSEPAGKVADYVKAGADVVTIHVESFRSAGETLSVLRELGRMENANDPDRGLVRGVAINPSTGIQTLEPLLEDLEMIVVLAVDPNHLAGGFFESTFDRFALARKMAESRGKDVILCVDGGVKRNNIDDIAKMGADLVVSGSALFKGNGPSENVPAMLSALRAAAV